MLSDHENTNNKSSDIPTTIKRIQKNLYSFRAAKCSNLSRVLCLES